MNKKWLYAQLNLSAQFLLHLLRLLVRPIKKKMADKTQEAFWQRYGQGQMAGMSPGEREAYAGFSRCISCGLCAQACPVLKAGGLFPQPDALASSLSRDLPEVWALKDFIYLCSDCGSCEALCPRGMPMREMVRFLRSQIELIQPQSLPPSHLSLKTHLLEKGNIYGKERVSLGYDKAKAPWVLFLGCVGRYREKQAMVDAMELLTSLKVDFTLIEEVCCAGPCLVLGLNGLRKSLMEENIQKIRARGAQGVIALCPQCYHTFKDSPFRPHDLQIYHIFQILADHPLKAGLREAVTYHDPCWLKRSFNLTALPRQILGNTGAQIQEMNQTKAMSPCCGAGGGLRGVSLELSLEMAKKRLKEAMETGAETLIADCPACLHNFKNALGSRKDLRILSLSQYLKSHL